MRLQEPTAILSRESRVQYTVQHDVQYVSITRHEKTRSVPVASRYSYRLCLLYLYTYITLKPFPFVIPFRAVSADTI